MNTIKKITLIQFRNYTSSVFDFVAPVTCITGSNGSGKTNLLDAIYYLCYTRSYFSSNQQNNVQIGCDGFRIEGVFHNDGQLTERVSCRWKAGKKEVLADGTPYERLTDHIGKYAAVVIAPDDLEIVNGGGELRRKWMDGILGQTDKIYLEKLMHYQRILLQRNAWLKLHGLNPPSNSPELEYYDQQLGICGSYIYKERCVFVRQFAPVLQDYYRKLSGGKEEIALHYRSDQHQNSLSEQLKSNLYNDLRLQRTLRGIHKDDLEFYIHGHELKQFGSQGQKKCYLFALKLAQYIYLSTVMSHLPILLLDDIFEKLDQQRMEALLHIIHTEQFGQVVLTDTHEQRVRDAFNQDALIDFIRL